MILKLIMTPVEQSSGPVDQVIKLIPDCDVSEFIKILDMKGIKRMDQGPFVEQFRAKAAHSSGHSIEVLHTDPQETSVESSRIKKLEKLIKKRL